MPLTFQLSASEAGVDRLVDVTRQIESYADTVVYGTYEGDFETVREVINRRGTATPPSHPV